MGVNCKYSIFARVVVSWLKKQEEDGTKYVAASNKVLYFIL